MAQHWYVSGVLQVILKFGRVEDLYSKTRIKHICKWMWKNREWHCWKLFSPQLGYCKGPMQKAQLGSHSSYRLSQFPDYFVNDFRSSGSICAAKLELIWFRGFSRAISFKCLEKVHPKSLCISQGLPQDLPERWIGLGREKQWCSKPECQFPELLPMKVLTGKYVSSPCLRLQLLLTHQVHFTLSEGEESSASCKLWWSKARGR